MNITPEILANLAAHLLHNGNLTGAVKQAYALLKAAEEEIQWQNAFEQQVLEHQPANDIPTSLKYADGILFITGQTRRDRAEQYFTDFTEREIRRSNARVFKIPSKKELKKELNAAITRYEKEGFAGFELAALRTMYQRFNRKSLDSLSNVKS